MTRAIELANRCSERNHNWADFILQAITILPGIYAAFLALTKSPQLAFVTVYLPALLCLPDYYRWVLPGLPDPSYSHGVVIPIAAIYVFRGAPRWRFSFTDVLVVGFATCVGYSEYLNAGYSEAQNLLFDMVCLVIAPYVLTKALVEPFGLRVEFAKRMVACLFWISLVSIWEFKFARTPWRMLLDPIYPGQADGWVTTFRWGFARIAGPYGHAILAGGILMVGYRIQRWLQWSNLWELRFQKFSSKYTKAQLLTAGIVAGILMTMVRGPWLGGVLAAGVVSIGRAKRRMLAIGVVFSVLVVIGIPIGIVFLKYASVGRANAKTVAQESAAYRKELIDKYVSVALEHSAWGWGRNTWPRVDGMPSIDNYYLLLAIMHGVPALACLLGIFVTMTLRLFVFEMSAPSPLPRGSSLGFTFIAIYVGIGWTIATVYLGAQLMPLLFVITGWAEGYLQSKQRHLGAAPSAVPVPVFRFQRVIS